MLSVRAWSFIVWKERILLLQVVHQVLHSYRYKNWWMLLSRSYWGWDYAVWNFVCDIQPPFFAVAMFVSFHLLLVWAWSSLVWKRMGFQPFVFRSRSPSPTHLEGWVLKEASVSDLLGFGSCNLEFCLRFQPPFLVVCIFSASLVWAW